MEQKRENRMLCVVDPELRKWFKTEAARTERTLSSLMIEALQSYAEQRNFKPNWRAILCEK